MIQIRLQGRTISLPIRDEEVIRMGDTISSALLLPTVPVECIRADAGGLDLKDKLPGSVWAQEMNMLAFVFTQFEEEQMEEFQRQVTEKGKMYGGEMLNLALAICPEAAGFEKGSTAIPQYTGENLFELMEYKRFLDRRREYPQYQIVKFYLPVYASFFPEDSDGLNEEDLTAKEAAIYQEPLSRRLEEQRHLTEKFGEWQVYEDSFHLPHYYTYGLLERRLDVEIRNGELWAVIIAEVDHPLTAKEIEAYQREFEMEIDYGILGERMEVPVENGTIFVHVRECREVYQQAKGELLLTEAEMFGLHAPYREERLENKTGFVPDFQDEWEYGAHHPVWLELFGKRKRVRIPLPAKEQDVADGERTIGASTRDHLDMRLKMPDTLPFRDYRLSGIDLEQLNQIAEGILRLEEKERQKLFIRHWDDSCDYKELLPWLRQTLEHMQKEPVKIRLYSTLCGAFYDSGGSYEFFHNYHLKGYEKEIQETLKKNWVQNCEGGLRKSLQNARLQERIVSMYPKVEAWGAGLWGVLEVESMGELEPEELESLKDEWYGQMTDGWGEGFVQEAVACNNGCELYVEFGRVARSEIKTEQELKGYQEHAAPIGMDLR